MSIVVTVTIASIASMCIPTTLFSIECRLSPLEPGALSALSVSRVSPQPCQPCQLSVLSPLGQSQPLLSDSTKGSLTLRSPVSAPRTHAMCITTESSCLKCIVAFLGGKYVPQLGRQPFQVFAMRFLAATRRRRRRRVVGTRKADTAGVAAARER